MAQKGNRTLNGGQEPVRTQTITDTTIGCTAVITSRLRVASTESGEDLVIDYEGARITSRGSNAVINLDSNQAAKLTDDFARWRSESTVFKQVRGMPEIDVAATADKARELGAVRTQTQTKVGGQLRDGDRIPVVVPRTPNNPLEQFCKGPDIS